MKAISKKLFSALFILLSLTMLPALAEAADTFTVTVAPNTEVTMQDANAVLPVTVTNTSGGGGSSIYELEFVFDPAKYTVSAATTAPSGWCVDKVDPVDGKVKFGLIDPSTGKCDKNPNGSQITPGNSLTFNIVLTPIAAVSDITNDTLADAKVKTPGGFARQGGLPTWTRRSLEVVLTATPESTGVGGVITLIMQVTNRSTAAQSGVIASPSVPTASSPIVTNTAGPYYGTALLSAGIDASTATIPVTSLSEFPSSGTIQIDSEKIFFTGKDVPSSSLTGGVRGYSGTTAAVHSSGAFAYSLDTFSLAAGGTRGITWKYSADSTGTVYFTARAANGAGNAKSVSTNSNTVVIGSFTAALAISPTSLVSGQSATVEMTVTNNGTTALVNVLPSALTPCAGGATETLSSGPAPSSVSSLAPGGSATFQWTYAMTGSNGQGFCLSGNGTADGPVTSNTATSNTGTISRYSATVSPAIITSGTAPQTFTWTIYNGGACSLEKVEIYIPTQGGVSWVYSSASAAGWTISLKTGPDLVKFKDPSASVLFPPGATRTFNITFNPTETVSADKDVSFAVVVTEAKTGGICNSGFEGYMGTYVTVSAYAMTLNNSPAGPIYADGSSYYTMTATLTTGGSPAAGKIVSFSTTNGTLSAGSAVTDASGIATVLLYAPNSTTDTSATVTASYLSNEKTKLVNFTGWIQANLQYWGSLSPLTVDCGSSYSFTMSVRNISTTASITLNTGSYFAFNDSSAGGTAEFKAYLNSSAAISPGATQSLTFGSPTSSGGGGGVAVPTGFIAGAYQPTADSTPPPASGLFFTDGGVNDQYRGVTDSVTLSAGCGAASVNINILEWYELR